LKAEFDDGAPATREGPTVAFTPGDAPIREAANQTRTRAKQIGSDSRSVSRRFAVWGNKQSIKAVAYQDDNPERRGT
jgi:hypothetical protein